ncbi:hypothetical protein D6825_00510 [Candidatus Woesearchaeota archaeon]|nr:MAG: hypothetical protein D6825_00510 [Candidatus Woesearchaeota archaeon]
MLTQDFINKVFSALRKAHNAHWRAPLADAVEKEIVSKGKFVFEVGSRPWLSRIIISRSGVEYVINSELNERFKKVLEDYKKVFEEELGKS